jgi:hypothetical protein
MPDPRTAEATSLTTGGNPERSSSEAVLPRDAAGALLVIARAALQEIADIDLHAEDSVASFRDAAIRAVGIARETLTTLGDPAKESP